MFSRTSWLAITVLLFLGLCWGDNNQKQATNAKKIDSSGRITIIRALNGEMVFVRKPLPMGTKGIVIRPDGAMVPDGPALEKELAVNGPAAKAGDRVRITDLIIKDKMIIFEINGGPVKKKKWYQRLEVGSVGGSTTVSKPTNELARGSFVAIEFDKFVPQITPDQLKERLAAVFDFNAKSSQEAYMEVLPPKAQQAIKDHKVLVGMNKQMVVFAIGQPERKIREKEGDVPYEEWIYGQPPSEVKFVRFVKDEVSRVETMQVDGQKIVDTTKQIDIRPLGEQTATAAQTGADPGQAPTLRRPGEKPESAADPTAPTTTAPPPIMGAPNPSGGPAQSPSETRVPQ